MSADRVDVMRHPVGQPVHVTVVAGPGLVADPDLLAQVTATESAALGVPGRFVAARDAATLRDLLAVTGRDGTMVVVVLPGADPAVRGLMTVAGPHAVRTLWCEITATGPVPVAAGSAHFEGRGIWGLAWAIRHAVHRVRRPARRIRYGPDPDQWGDLRLPAGPTSDPSPVAVLVHGGFWRSIWGADLMDALAIDLTDRGYATWNLEYRRPDRHGWAATTADLAAGLAALANLADPPARDLPADGADLAGDLDLDRVAVIGHSAGGQLALRLAADTAQVPAAAVRVALAVSLAGVLDLAEGDRRGVGTGAVSAALGGRRDELPEVYADADPIARLPIGTPQLIVQGGQDDLDLIDLNRRYVTAARAAGEEVTWLERPGDHFAVIDPTAAIWHATVVAMGQRLSR